jgi:hypothetical protein
MLSVLAAVSLSMRLACSYIKLVHISSAKRMPVKRVYTPGLLMELSRQDQEAGDDLRELLEKKRLIVTKVRARPMKVEMQLGSNRPINWSDCRTTLVKLFAMCPNQSGKTSCVVFRHGKPSSGQSREHTQK